MGISVFYHSLKVKVKLIDVDMKNGTMNVVFMTIFLFIYSLQLSLQLYIKLVYITTIFVCTGLYLHVKHK